MYILQNHHERIQEREKKKNRLQDKKSSLTSAPSPSISNHDATCSDERQGFFRARCIPLRGRRNSQHKPRDDVGRAKRASCHVHCNQTQRLLKMSSSKWCEHSTCELERPSAAHFCKPQMYRIKTFSISVSQFILSTELFLRCSTNHRTQFS